MKKKITLKSIELKDWKSLNISAKFNDGVTIVKGKNGIGKTSLQSAWNWLWTGYCNSYTPKNHELFDNKTEITHETPIAMVKAWVEIDGIEYTVEKTAQAKFTRVRGTNEYQKSSSDVYTIKIDGIEITPTAFNEWIDANLCPIDMIPYCLDGTFFSTLCEDDKKKGRKILENIVGEINLRDYAGDYSCFDMDFKKGYSIEQIEERVKKEMKSLKDEIESLSILIKSQDGGDGKNEDYTKIEKEIENKNKEIENIDKAILGMVDTEERKLLLDKIDKLKKELQDKEREYESSMYNSIVVVRNKITNANIDNISIAKNNAKIEELKNTINKEEAYLNAVENVLLELREEKNKIKSMVFNECVCEYCGQNLPSDVLEKLKRDFNDRKERSYKAIIETGLSKKKVYESQKERIENLKNELSQLSFKEIIDINELNNELIRLKEQYVEFKNTDEYIRLSSDIERVQNEIDSTNVDNTGLMNMRNVLVNEIIELNKKLSEIEIYKKKKEENKSRIERHKQLGIELAIYEGILFKCKEFIEERASIISKRVNNMLANSTIEMFSTQKNGDKTPDCIIKNKYGVKYSTMNNSHRILTNIELQNMFCEHYGVDFVTFIDEASVFDDENLPKFKKQCVYLYASNNDGLCFS